MLSPIALAQPSSNTQPDGKNPKLESILSQLINADNPQEFARSHNLYIRDGNTRVVVELINEKAMLPDYVVEETRYKNNAQVLVPIDKMATLSLETNVSFIRTPLKAYADTPKSGFNTAIPVILSIALLFLFRKVRSDRNVKK